VGRIWVWSMSIYVCLFSLFLLVIILSENGVVCAINAMSTGMCCGSRGLGCEIPMVNCVFVGELSRGN
jgi:hypothetical protein